MGKGNPGNADQRLVVLAMKDERVNDTVAEDFQRGLMALL